MKMITDTRVICLPLTIYFAIQPCICIAFNIWKALSIPQKKHAVCLTNTNHDSQSSWVDNM